jgi:hypothetical protein
MAVFLLFLYLTLAYIRPFELLPWLGAFHLMQLVGGAGMLLTVLNLPRSRFTFQEKQLYLTLLFLGIVIMSRTLAQRWIGGAIVSFEEVGITGAVFLITIINVYTLQNVRRMIGLLALLSLYLVLQSHLAVRYGFFSDLLLFTQRVSDFSDDLIVRVRSTGFMTDPNDLAQSLVLAIPFFMFFWRKHSPLRNLFVVLLPICLLLYGVYLTHSRGAIISLAVMLLIASRSALGTVLGGLVSMGGIALGMLINFTGGRAMGSTADGGTRSRIEFWSTGLEILKHHPFVGVGYRQFVDNNATMTAHNSVVLCFAELGFPAFCVWVSLILLTILDLNAIRKLPVQSPEDEHLRRCARAIQLSLYGFLTAAWFLSRTYTLTLYLLIAMAAAVVSIARRSGKPLPLVSFPRLASMSMVAAMGLIVLVYMTIKFSIR